MEGEEDLRVGVGVEGRRVELDGGVSGVDEVLALSVLLA